MGTLSKTDVLTVLFFFGRKKIFQEKGKTILPMCSSAFSSQGSVLKINAFRWQSSPYNDTRIVLQLFVTAKKNLFKTEGKVIKGVKFVSVCLKIYRLQTITISIRFAARYMSPYSILKIG
jgi:hypothetical protein